MGGIQEATVMRIPGYSDNTKATDNLPVCAWLQSFHHTLLFLYYADGLSSKADFQLLNQGELGLYDWEYITCCIFWQVLIRSLRNNNDT